MFLLPALLIKVMFNSSASGVYCYRILTLNKNKVLPARVQALHKGASHTGSAADASRTVSCTRSGRCTDTSLREAVLSAAATPACPMAKPALYSGEVLECPGFIMQCQLYFDVVPQQFPNDHAKIAFILSLLFGEARRWAEALWTSGRPALASLEGFLAHIKAVFSSSTSTLSVHDKLYSRLGTPSVSTRFTSARLWPLAAGTKWRYSRLTGGVYGPKSENLSSEDLESFMLKVSQHLALVAVEENNRSDTSPYEDSSAPEAMQTDEYHLSGEHQRWLQRGLCLYCGDPGHSIQTCPVHPPCPAVSTIHLSSILTNP